MFVSFYDLGILDIIQNSINLDLVFLHFNLGLFKGIVSTECQLHNKTLCVTAPRTKKTIGACGISTILVSEFSKSIN